MIRYCPALQRKVEESGRGKDTRNPFLPPEATLILSPIQDSHLLVFNKYCVMPNHLLLLTREFIRQEEPLELRDFVAAWRAMEMLPGRWMCFYNSGVESGASQPHRHLQMIPDSNPPITKAFKSDGSVTIYKDIVHRLVYFDDPSGDGWYEVYRKMRTILPTEASSYSLLFTREWMLMVPRYRECYQKMSFSTMAFAGYLLSCYPQDLDLLLGSDIEDIFNTLGYSINT